jgi:2-methylisocitrate lyase-like PEP mutase family enzyme
MSLDDSLGACRRMVDRLAIPVSVDLEVGYAAGLQGLSETISKETAAGAVGINIEESAKAGCGGPGSDGLLDPSAQGQRIATIREAANRFGIPLVINARTDVILEHGAVSRERLGEAFERGNAYRRAGGDCVFVPDMGELEGTEIAALVNGIDAPLNRVAGGSTPSVRRFRNSVWPG